MNATWTSGLVVALAMVIGIADAAARDRPPPRRARPARYYRAPPPPPPRYVPSPPPVVRVYPAPAPVPVYVPAPVYVAPPPPPPPVAVVTPVERRPSLAPAPYLGIGGSAGTIAGGVGSLRHAGGGLDAFVGVELGRWAALEVDWASSWRSGDEVRSVLHSITVEGKAFALPSGSAVRPYVSFGAGAYMLQPDLQVHQMVAGPALAAGIGADVVIGGHFLIGAKVGWRGMYVDDAPRIGMHDRPTAFLNDVSGTIRAGFRF